MSQNLIAGRYRCLEPPRSPSFRAYDIKDDRPLIIKFQEDLEH